MCTKNHPCGGIPWSVRLFELVMKPLNKLRPKTIGKASGRVLELGVGTGLNLPHYRDVQEVVGLDPDARMLARAQERSRRFSFPVELVEGSAEALPFADASFDSVVATWVFCSIPDPLAASRELRRVLKPGGSFFYLEHTASARPGVARVQHWVTPVWKRCTGGCRLDREPLAFFLEAGLDSLQHKLIGAPSLSLFPQYAGHAQCPASSGVGEKSEG